MSNLSGIEIGHVRWSRGVLAVKDVALQAHSFLE